ncbi:hypothetical protein Ancab_000894 [Ancistrocladus abbreviatus]
MGRKTIVGGSFIAHAAILQADMKRSIEEAEKWFYQLSIERSEGSLMKRHSSMLTTSGDKIPVSVAAEGVLEPPTVNGSKDLKEALQKLGSIPSSRTVNENDALSELELLEDYPLLRPL